MMAQHTPVETMTKNGESAWRWSGPDERGRELDIIAVEVQGERDAEPVLLVIHAMPTYGRKDPS